jgi:NADH-quinone oxidoreductase subunit M
MVQRVLFGEISEANAKMPDMSRRELATFIPLIAAAVWIGLYPQPFFKVMDAPVAKLMRQVNPTYGQGPALEQARALPESAPEGGR